MRWRRLAAVAAVLAGTALLAGSWVLFTGPGLRWSLGLAERLTGGALSVGEARGRLAGRMTLEGVAVDTPALGLSVRTLEVRFVPAGLFRMTLTVGSAEAQGVDVSLRPEGDAPAPPEPSGPFSLPLGIDLGLLTVRDIRVIPAEAATPVTLDSVRLSGRMAGSAARVDYIHAEAYGAVLELRGGLDLAPALDLDLRTAWSFAGGDLPVFRGGGTVKGTLEELGVEQEVMEPFQARVSGSVSLAGSLQQWRARADIPGVDPGLVFLGRRTGEISGRLLAEGTLEAFSASGDLSASRVPGLGESEVRVLFDGRYEDGAWLLSHLSARIPGSPALLEAEGRYAGGGEGPEAELSGSWEGLSLPPGAGDPLLASPSGDFRAYLDQAVYGLEASGTLGALHLEQGPFALSLRGHGPGLTVRNASFSMGQSSATASGTLDGSWDAIWRLDLGDLGGIFPAAGGRLILGGAVKGQRESPAVTAEVRGTGLSAPGLAASFLSGTVEALLGTRLRFSTDLVFKDLEAGPYRAGEVTLTGSGDASDHTLEASITGGLLPAELSLSGGVLGSRWRGTAEILALDGTIGADGAFAWGATPSWEGTLLGDGLQLDEIKAGLPRSLAFEASFSGEESDGTAATGIRLVSARADWLGETLEAVASGTFSEGRAALENARVDLGNARVQASGTLDDKGWDFSWNAMVPDLGALPGKARGRMTASGSLAGPREAPVLETTLQGEGLGAGPVDSEEATARAGVALEPGYPFTFTVEAGPLRAGAATVGRAVLSGEGTLGGHRVQVELRGLMGEDATAALEGALKDRTWNGSLTADLLGGVVKARGDARLGDSPSFRASVSGAGLDPSSLLPSWPGDLSFALEAEGSPTGGGLRYALSLEDLAGTLRSVPVEGSGRLAVQAGVTVLEIPSLAVGSAGLTASLRSGEDIRGSWSLQVGDLGVFLQGTRGSLRGEGEVMGTAGAPSFSGSLTATGLAGGSWSVGSAALRGSVPDLGRSAGRLRLSASDISLGTAVFGQASLEAEGTLGDHSAAFVAEFPGGSASMGIGGRMEGGTWRGVLRRIELDHASRGRWTLESPTAASASSSAGKVEPVCLVQAGGRVCIDGGWSGGTAEGRITIADAPLAALSPGEASRLKLEGPLDGQVLTAFDGRAWHGSMRLSSPGGSIVYPAGFGKWASLHFGETVLTSSLSGSGLEAGFETSLGARGSPDRVTWNLEMPGLSVPSDAPLRDQALQGTLEARLTDLGFVQAFLPRLQSPSGSLSGVMDLGGTVGRPVLEGSLSVEEGSALVPLLGLHLKQVQARVTGDRERRISLQASATSGKGGIRAEGRAGIRREGGPFVELAVKGEAFTASQTPDLSLVVSPDIKLASREGLIDVSGTVRVPEAVFRPREFSGAHALSPDVVVVDAPPGTQPEPPPAVSAEVTIVLEDKVTFEGFGLSGRVQGTVRLLEEPGKVTSATGELTIVDGLYQAYGQNLSIERGKLIFSGGPAQNPGLDVRAVRRTGEVLAGVQVGGTLMEPVVSLFSEPPMDQADALSYLLLGKPLRRASGDEGQVLNNAALKMGLSGGEALAGRIGRSFGFEEVTVETESEVEESALVVGRYLTPRIYVRYGVGIFQSFSLFQFGYRITDRLLLQGESGAQTGTDLLYNVER